MSEGRGKGSSLLNTAAPLVGAHQSVRCFWLSCTVLLYQLCHTGPLIPQISSSESRKATTKIYLPPSLLLDKVVSRGFTLSSLSSPVDLPGQTAAAHLRTVSFLFACEKTSGWRERVVEEVTFALVPENRPVVREENEPPVS